MKLLWKTLLFLTVIGFTACDSDDENATPDASTEDINSEILMVSDEQYALSELNSIYSMTNEVFNNESKGGRIEMSFCADVAIDTTNRQILLDFGQGGCTSEDGRKRSGMIIITYVGKIRDLDNRRSVQFENYTVDGTSINGSFSTSTFTKNIAGKYHFDREVDLTVNKSDGTNFSVQANHDFVMVAGEGSEDIFAIVFEITGSSSGVSAEEGAFSSQITSPLVLKTACLQDKIPYPVSGVIEFSQERKTTTVDFGEGNCDKLGTVTVGKVTKDVEFP